MTNKPLFALKTHGIKVLYVLVCVCVCVWCFSWVYIISMERNKKKLISWYILISIMMAGYFERHGNKWCQREITASHRCVFCCYWGIETTFDESGGEARHKSPQRWDKVGTYSTSHVDRQGKGVYAWKCRTGMMSNSKLAVVGPFSVLGTSNYRNIYVYIVLVFSYTFSTNY